MTLKQASVLGLFKILPLVELFVAFLGEWISLKIDKKFILIFCMLYPVFMGSIQKTMDWLDSKSNLELDSIAEMQSLFYASLPYKLVYLGLEDVGTGLIVLFIKLAFKVIVYVIVPFVKFRKNANMVGNQILAEKSGSAAALFPNKLPAMNSDSRQIYQEVDSV